ncbi:MAG: DsbA family protein [Qipengyuania sp.]
MKQSILTALTAALFGFAGAAIWSFSGLGHGQLRDYLVSNPDILPQMAEALQQQQSADRLVAVADEVKAPFPGAVLGNPDGSKLLVKFTDYGCGYCRASVADIERLVAKDPELKVVVREWPIFSGSEEAARMGLAAAEQGKFGAFYRAMFETGSPTPENVADAAAKAGLDMDRARSFARSEAATAELVNNASLARTLGFSGTPSWVAGDRVLEGAVGYDELAEAVKGSASAS